jgi:hypothetical protein
MTNAEATIAENAAAVAEQGAHVAPEKASSKKGATQKKGAPKGQKRAKGKAKASSKKEAKAGKKAKPAQAKEASAPRAESKGAKILALIGRPKGACLAEIAAIRPRFGGGPRTAMLAGAAVWALAYASSNAAMVFLHLFPLGLMLSATAVGLVETLVAGLAGAALYKEGAESARSMPARA